MAVDAGTRELVRRRASNRCEYCLLRQEHSRVRRHIEHIVAKQHGGRDDPDNLALACHRCNLRKGPNLTPAGRATVHVLAMNDARRLELRSVLLARGDLR